jgi:hypothetical protein
VLPFFSANEELPTISSTSKSSKSSKSNSSSDAHKSVSNSGRSTTTAATAAAAAKGVHIAAPVPFTPAYMEAGFGSSVYEDARSSRSSSGATAAYDTVQRRRSMSNVNTSGSTSTTATAAAATGAASGAVSNGRSTVSRAFSDVSSDVSSSNGSSSVGSNVAVVYSAADNTELQLQHLQLSDDNNSSSGVGRSSRSVSGVRGEFRMRELSWREDESPSEATSSRVCTVYSLHTLYSNVACID